MDIVSADTITRAIMAAAGAAGTAAGRQAWEALQPVLRRALHRRGPAGELAAATTEVEPAGEPRVRELVGTVIEQDPEFAGQLSDWAREHAGTLNVAITYDQRQDHSRVSNTVSGDAKVQKLLQGRDFTGTINM
ncbi:hypothetical protein [Kitasatospora sp. LaBMicrA B282]|uniref:hypothetical protein n=1 Tax=Kitasatospora sp. LaBMicrA B282 TaxID=3420949 RepID=UPI003D12E090